MKYTLDFRGNASNEVNDQKGAPIHEVCTGTGGGCIGLLDPDPGAKSSSNPKLFGAVKMSGNPFLEDLLKLYMDLEQILERFISKKFLRFRIGKTRI